MNMKLMLSKAGLVLKETSPDILTAGGIILGVAALITACSKMKKAEEVKEEFKEEVNEIREDETLEPKKQALGCCKAAGKAAFRYLKVFWLAILLEAMSIGAIWYSHGMMMKKNAALTSTAMILTQQLEKYRERVKQKVGEEVEKELYYNMASQKVDEIITDENGKEKKVKTVKKVLPGELENPWDRVFDSQNHNYKNGHPGMNITFLSSILNNATVILHSRATEHSNGWLYLNELYSMLGFEPTELGSNWGWVWSRFDPRFMDTIIDIGLNNNEDPVYRDFVNGLEAAFPLHFNCRPVNLDDLSLMRV